MLLTACGSSPTPPPLLTRPATAYLLTLDQLKAPGFVAVEAPHLADPSEVAGRNADLMRARGLRDAATVRFFRSVPQLATANGPLDVRSTVLRFSSSSGAESSYAILTGTTDGLPGMVPMSAGALGDESHADELHTTASDGTPLLEDTITWRVENLVLVLVVRGRDAGNGLSDALILAHEQTATLNPR